MAQDYVGSNNINLLQPNGQFGTHNYGGKDHASARYVYTWLSPITQFLFHKDDDDLLDYLNEDVQSIEPTWYIPIIRMVLVNGSEGIGTGWSSYVPNYNPRDIIANIRRLLNGDTMEPMDPWYKWFKRTIEKTAAKEGGNSYTICGTIEEVNETTLMITELPICRWTHDYKEFLESISSSNKECKDPFIEDFDMNCDDVTVEFDVFLTPENLIRKFLLNKREMELLKLENKVRFILAVVKGEIIVSNRKRADLFVELQTKGFTPFPKKTKAIEPEVAGATDDTEETEVKSPADSSSNGVQISDYEYLLAMAIGSLTIEKVQELCAERDKLNKEVDDLRKETPKSFWRKDLDASEGQLDELKKSDAQSEELRKKMRGKARGEVAMKSTRPAPKNPRKNNNKKANTAESVAEAVSSSMAAMEIAKPKGRASSRKASAKPKKRTLVLNGDGDDDDDDVLELKERLAAYNLDSSPDQSAAMGTEVSKVPAKKKEPSRRAAAAQKKKPLATVSEISDDDDDEESEIEVVAAPEAGKKGRRKLATNAKAFKAPAAAKKRGAANKQQPQTLGQRLLTDMLKPAENSGISPEKKVRKMRASPFNKKSGSVLGRVGEVNEVTENEENSGSASTSASTEKIIEVASARARPQRVNRAQTWYVLSDSESEHATEDSEFDEVTDESEDE